MAYIFPAKSRKAEVLPSIHSVMQPARDRGNECRRAAAEHAGEAFCFWLANSLGLPVDTWQLWASFDSESGLWFEESRGYIAPVVRICHASWLAPGSDSSETYEIIPSKWQSRVGNRSDFAGMAMFDAWAGARQSRRAIYVGQPDGTLRALFLSHGKMFNIQGDDGTIHYEPWIDVRKLVRAHRHALSEWTEASIASWAGKLRSLDAQLFEAAFDYAYADWQPDEWEDSVRAYIARRHADIDAIAEAMIIELEAMSLRI